MAAEHVSVLHGEAVEALAIRSDGFYVDATYGRGGHSQSILQALGEQGRLMAMDCDSDAIEHAGRQFAADGRFSIVHCNYSEIESALTEVGAPPAIDGVLFDLGVSSPQLDQAQRGFSFDHDGPLDMRMDQTRGQPVSEWLAGATQEELTDVFRSYGEERYAKRIAAKVIEVVQQRPVTTTGDLAEIIKKAHPRWEKHKHPATRCFQALRIFINRELDNLKAALDTCINLIKPGGRLVVISFHSLEDRIVKRFIKGAAERKNVPRGMPVLQPEAPAPFVSVGKAVRPGAAEVAANPRSRSSIMRVAERAA